MPLDSSTIDDADNNSPNVWGRWQLFEVALLSVGLACWLALLLRAGWRTLATLEVGIACLLYAAAIFLAKKWSERDGLQRLRCVVGYLFTLWFFGAMARIVPALYASVYDSHLLAIDRWMWSETPSALWTGSVWFTQVMSAAYLSYLVYLHAVLGYWWWHSLTEMRRLWTYVFVTYSVGFVGYLLVPAVGPKAAFPQLYAAPIVGHDSWLFSFNQLIVSRGSGVYDVFPSLHVLITCVLLDFERRKKPMRFWAMLPVALLLFASTLYLRYHYAVDLIAGFALFAGLVVWFSRWLRRYDGAKGNHVSS